MAEALASIDVSVPHSWVDAEDPGVLYLEDIGEHEVLQSSIEATPAADDVRAAVGTAARALALLHAQPPSVDPTRSVVVLHGDFSAQNVLLTADGLAGGSRLWIVDPSPNYYGSFVVGERGDPLVDVATFTLRLLWPFRRSTYRGLRARLALRKVFVRSYASDAGNRRCTSTAVLRVETSLFFRYLLCRKLLRLHDRFVT